MSKTSSKRRTDGTMKVGFIGVGFMGHGMAKNLLLKGFPVTILGHRNRKPVDDLIKRAAATSSSSVCPPPPKSRT